MAAVERQTALLHSLITGPTLQLLADGGGQKYGTQTKKMKVGLTK
jgi:hypothetical protein